MVFKNVVITLYLLIAHGLLVITSRLKNEYSVLVKLYNL